MGRQVILSSVLYGAPGDIVSGLVAHCPYSTQVQVVVPGCANCSTTRSSLPSVGDNALAIWRPLLPL
jgi:hypothetical protein